VDKSALVAAILKMSSELERAGYPMPAAIETLSRDNLKAMRRAGFKAYLANAVAGMKTQSQFERMVYSACRDLYNGKIDEYAFIDSLTYAVAEQYERAFNAGLRDNGLDPQDAKPEWRDWLEAEIRRQDDFIIRLVEDVLEARDNESGLDEFKQRAQLWSNRYPEVQSEVTLMSSNPTDLLEWVMGNTEEHCETCATLSGSVATAQEWQESGYHPQGAPNELLECGGWRCDCSLIPTDKPHTGIPL
jgi:hypothetical protein